MPALAGAVVGLACSLDVATAGTILQFTGPDGLKAEAEFTLIDATTLEVRLKNTSTGVPGDFAAGADQILTSISWDFGGTTSIAGGTVTTGPASFSLGFSVMNVGANEDVSGEFGFGNGGTTSLHANFISANTAGTTPFGGANLDGPVSLNGPQGGLVASPLPIGLGGQGAIQDEWIATLSLAGDALVSLDFLDNGISIEYGSDRTFVHAPEPASFALAAAALVALIACAQRRRSGLALTNCQGP